MTRQTRHEISLEGGGNSTSDLGDYENVVGEEISGTQAGTVYSGVTNVSELEMLLGAYFVQIGGTVNKLSALSDYVEDTEDYINITLDDNQNRILQTGVQIGTASVILNCFVAVTGVFGMNIHIQLFDDGGMKEFLGTIFGCTGACVILYFLAMLWYKKMRMLE